MIFLFGGGIIRLLTAHYVVEDEVASHSQVRKIATRDLESQIFAGSSGGGTGIVGDFAFSPTFLELGTLSWELLKRLNHYIDGQSN